MKKLAVVVVNIWLSSLLWTPVHAAQFFCSSGDVTCLIKAINEANTHAGADTINLDPGTYTPDFISRLQRSANHDQRHHDQRR